MLFGTTKFRELLEKKWGNRITQKDKRQGDNSS